MCNLADRARAIFLDAIEKYPPEQWTSYVNEACGVDTSLRARVEKLLQARAQLGSFHEVPRPSPVAVKDEALTERPGTVIGSYKLLEQIGEGGMGLVFVAEQQQPIRRKVALKLVKPGMDSKQVLARFEAERQALAMMDHPHIAKVLDAGSTEAGRPYFVMELVYGIPVTDYCDQAQLRVAERLALFVQVCRAVQHAHQKGIIHRDLKPSNVLVSSHDGVPVPQVIDFGVAKALAQPLTDQTVYTGFTQLIGTPLYMSPEQAEFNPQGVDTRSDIYSLGVLLYELLTGTTPFNQEQVRAAGLDEFRRLLREEEPPRPSDRVSTLGVEACTTVCQRRGVDVRRLGQLLRGELDWIVMKALEKDRNRRYESASALAADVQRYLDDEPVQACPPSAAYRLRKFARRHRVAFITVGLVVTGLFTTTVLVWRERDKAQVAYLAEAEQGRRRVETLGQALRALDEVYVTVSEKRLPTKPRPDPEDRELLERALSFYATFAERNAADPLVWPELVRAYRRVGRIREQLGHPQEAESAYRQAIAVAEQLEPERATAVVRRECADAHEALGHLLKADGRTSEAEQAFRTALSACRELESAFAAEPEYRASLASKLNSLATQLLHAGHLEGAEELFREAITTYQELTEKDPHQLAYRVDLAGAQHNRSTLLHKRGELAEARQLLNQAIDQEQTVLKQSPRQLRARVNLRNHWLNLAEVLVGLGEHTAAEAASHRAVDLANELVRDYPGVPEYQNASLSAKERLTWVLSVQGKFQEGEQSFQQAVAVGEQLVKDFPHVPWYRLRLVQTLDRWAGVHSLNDRDKEAIQLTRQAQKHAEALVAEHPTVAAYRSELGRILDTVGMLLWVLVVQAQSSQPQEDLKESRQVLEEAIRHHQAALEFAPRDSHYRNRLGESYVHLAYTLEGMGLYREAMAAYEADIALRPTESISCNHLATLLMTCPDQQLRDAQRAVELASKAVERQPKNAAWQDGSSWGVLAWAQYRVADTTAATAAAEKALHVRPSLSVWWPHDGLPWGALVLALIHEQRGEREQALARYHEADRWLEQRRPQDRGGALWVLRAEAAERLGIRDASPKP